MSSKTRALLAIDMQNNFLDERGASSKRHRDPRELAETLGWVVNAARQQGDWIVWITSMYAGAPEALRGQTHTGRPCCVAGSWSAALYGPVARLPEPHDVQIDKARLAATGSTELLLAGAATNVQLLNGAP